MSSETNKTNEVKLELIGSQKDQFSLNNDDSNFEITHSFNLGSTVRGKLDHIKVEMDAETIIQLTTEDSFEWIGNHEDIAEINAVKKKYGRSGEPALVVSNNLTTKSSTRSFQGTVENIGIDLITRKGASIAADILAKKIDKKLMPEPGLYGVDEFLKIQRNPEFRPNTKYLLLIHGTFSSTEGSFGDLRDNTWGSIYNQYEGRILALDHYTVSESPGANVLTLLDQLPDNVQLDIMTTSRGGLVADLLARCDQRVTGDPFTESEITFVKDSSGGESFLKEMKKINTEVKSKNITIDKIIRVACPASGTVLLDKRLDHFLNFIMNAVQLALGGPTNMVYRVIKTFLLEVVKNRHKADAFPGLWSMVPQSAYQKINNGQFSLPSSVVAIAGDTKIGGGIWNSIKVIMTNLYYLQDNDFVVNTKAMTRGLRNRANFYMVSFTSSKINHFRYFEYEKSVDIITRSLSQNLTQVDGLSLRTIQGDRGLLKDIFIKLKEVKSSNKVDTEKPVVVLLPGIMGSCLHYNNRLMWVSGKEIGDGALANHLQIDGKNVTSDSAIAMFYKKFKEFYEQNGFHVVLATFDWRKSVSDAAAEFDKLMNSVMNDSRENSIVSHSMGGLVVREWMQSFPASWKRFKAINRSKWIMLGTPWLGSYLIMEVLTGHAKRLKQLAWLDETEISRKGIIEIVAKYPGVIELLPIWEDSDDFSSLDFWKEIQKRVGDDKMPIPPASSRNLYKEFRKKYGDSGIKEEDRDKIFYIAGHKDRTVSGYKKEGEFKYSKTFRGDGSVTWDSGIPKNIKPEHVFYSNISHSNLANKHLIFRAIYDILFKDTTDELAVSEVGLRLRGEVLQEEVPDYTEEVVDYYDEEMQINNLFDLEDEETDERTTDILHVNVFNADLKWSKSPVMVGHFENDSIVSAEQAIDRYLNGKLSERMAIASYPGKIGEQTIVFAPDSSPKGAIVIGLGPKDELTGYELARTVTKAVVKYAILLRDSLSDSYSIIAKDSISSLLVASGYGKLSKQESIRSIILGIHNANAVIGKLNNNLTKIKYLEFVDYYEDKAYECYKILRELQEERNQISIMLKDDIEHGFGSRKRFLRRESSSWWHSLTTVMKQDELIQDGKLVKKDPFLEFSSYSGLSSVSVKSVRSNLKLAEYITKHMSLSSEWNKKDSKTVFEMLLPNAYKDFVRNHRNIEWKMDVFAAQFPWEMFHDTNYGEKPTFVESGIIRQLYSTEATVKPMLVNNNKALVIGDPVYKMKELPQLDGALLEAKKVVELLKLNQVEVEVRLRSTPMEIIKSLLADEYKVLHIAAHGLYDPENGKVGIAIGDGQFLDPGTITQMTAIPEFVFINCCFGGKIVEEDERYTENRHKLAANVGTEFIKIGVKAVIVAGWEIDDNAALVFAQEFYRHMYNGDIFGYAIQKARHTVYEQFKKTNTWGAYQCYGDQFYRLTRKNSYDDELENITLEREIVLELDNLLSSTRSLELVDGTTVDPLFKLKERVKKLIERSKEINKYSSRVMISEVEIYINLGHYEKAIAVLELLQNTENDAFTFTLFDRYFNIRSKEIIRDYYLVGTRNRSHETEMKDVVLGMEAFSSEIFGQSYNKLNATGSTYKRAGIILKKKRKAYFKIAAEKYFEAGLQKGIMSRNAIYPITSFITLCFLSIEEKSKFNREIKKALGRTALQYLHKKDKDIEKEFVNRSDVWDQLAEIQLKVCRMVIQEDEREELYEQIVDLYKLQIRKCINMKDLIGEIEHMEFLSKLHPDGNTRDLFEKLKNILRSFLGLR